MNKRFFALILSAALLLSLCACTKNEEDFISGTSFDQSEYDTASYARYENVLYGIIIEYPENYERVGNFELDGYITFEGEDTAISIYVPDVENNDILTPEEYVEDVLELDYDDDSIITKYGKSSGFKAVTREDGNIRIDFIVKGVDGFYRFGFETAEEGFSEEDIVFQTVMSSIRIDDGIYNKLSRMSNRYDVLLEYATSMQYITDTNYANHCLNNFISTKEERHKQDALTTIATIEEEIGKILTHEREEDEGYDDQWQEITEEAQLVLDACTSARELISAGDIEGAQKILRTEFKYDLSDNSSAFISMINAELAEY